MKFHFTLFLFLLVTFTGYSQLDSTTIPVRLSYFEAGSGTGNTTLRWRTVCYLDFANFEIQKSTDGTNYQLINSFTADKRRCQQPFDFTDNHNGPAARIFYQINVKDIDGKAYQSKIVSVFTTGRGFAINSFSPTIINSNATISISSATNETIQLSVINFQGSMAKKQTIAVTRGAGTYLVSMDGLPKGKYLAVFQTLQGGKKSIRFIKQ